jgi:hypothetical protein
VTGCCSSNSRPIVPWPAITMVARRPSWLSHIRHGLGMVAGGGGDDTSLPFNGTNGLHTETARRAP